MATFVEHINHQYSVLADQSDLSRPANGNPAVQYEIEFNGGADPGFRTYFDRNRILRTAGVGEFRHDHDPVTGAKRGALLENQFIYNEVRDSEDVSGTGWTSSGTLASPVAATGPDDTSSAEILQDDDATASSHYISTSSQASGNDETWAVSVRVKKDAIPATTRFVALGLEFQNGGTPTEAIIGLDTSTGAVQSTLLTGSGTIEAGDGKTGAETIVNSTGTWYWLKLTFTNDASGNLTPRLKFYPGYGANADLATTDVTVIGDGPTAHGFQLEKNVCASSYVKTTGARQLRRAETVHLVQEATPSGTGWYSPNDSEHDGFLVYVDWENGCDVPTGDAQGDWKVMEWRLSSSYLMRLEQDPDNAGEYAHISVVNGGGLPTITADHADSIKGVGRQRIVALFGTSSGFTYLNGVKGTEESLSLPSWDAPGYDWNDNAANVDLGFMGHLNPGQKEPRQWLREVRFYDQSQLTIDQLNDLGLALSGGESGTAPPPPGVGDVVTGGGGSGAKASALAARGGKCYPQKVVFEGRVYVARSLLDETHMIAYFLQILTERLNEEGLPGDDTDREGVKNQIAALEYQHREAMEALDICEVRDG